MEDIAIHKSGVSGKVVATKDYASLSEVVA